MAQARQGAPACGRGWDAVCHLGMHQGASRVELVFSGTYPGTPLIALRVAP